MAGSPSQGAPGPAAWAEVLTRVGAALAHAEEEAGLREQRYPPAPAPERAAVAAWGEFDRRLADVDACADRAGQETRAAELVLQEAEEGVRAWRGRAAACAAGLATGTGRRIG